MAEQHVHGCPVCYENVPCDLDCTIERDLGKTRAGLPFAGYAECEPCLGQMAPQDPCPFCGEKRGIEVGDIRTGARWIRCMTCGAHGPSAGRGHSAVLAWNRRECARVALRRAAEMLREQNETCSTIDMASMVENLVVAGG